MIPSLNLRPPRLRWPCVIRGCSCPGEVGLALREQVDGTVVARCIVVCQGCADLLLDRRPRSRWVETHVAVATGYDHGGWWERASGDDHA